MGSYRSKKCSMIFEAQISQALYKQCRLKRVFVYGITTDCSLLDRKEIIKVNRIFSAQMNTSMSSLKLEYSKSVRMHLSLFTTT